MAINLQDPPASLELSCFLSKIDLVCSFVETFRAIQVQASPCVMLHFITEMVKLMVNHLFISSSKFTLNDPLV